MQIHRNGYAIVLGCLLAWIPTAHATPSISLFPVLLNQVSPTPGPNKQAPQRIKQPRQAKHISPAKIKRLTRRFIQGLRFNQHAEIHSMFSARLKKEIPLAGIRNIWMMIQLRMGKFRKIEKIQVKPFRKFFFSMATCAFSGKRIVWRLVFDQNLQIAGMQFLPAKPRKGAKAKKVSIPTYANHKRFVEKTVLIQANGSPWKLIGTLTTPKGRALVPVVVLVHGSGPHDQDETIGPNKVFRDIAWGLASQGIAVLRYTKRTKAMGQVLRKLSPAKRKQKALAIRKQITPEKETIDDAVAAVQLLAQTKGIDPKRIFVFGHSLGAMLAPAIVKKAPNVAGLIMMGTPARALEDLVLDQIMYLSMLDGKLDPSEQKKLQETIHKVILIKSGKLTDKTPMNKRLLGMSPLYVRSLHRNAPIPLMKSIKKPVILLQGGRDYQVSMTDFNGWKRALKGRKNATFKLYPTLNHLFMKGTGKPGPSEYINEGHVSKQVIQDVATWLKQQKAPVPPTPPTADNLASGFLHKYVAAYKNSLLKEVMGLYQKSPTTISISSRGARFVGFKQVKKMYSSTFQNVEFLNIDYSLLSAKKLGKYLIFNAQFGLTSRVRKRPKIRYLVQSQGSFFLQKIKGKWKIVHEHFSPLLGVPRLQQIK